MKMSTEYVFYCAHFVVVNHHQKTFRSDQYHHHGKDEDEYLFADMEESDEMKCAHSVDFVK